MELPFLLGQNGSQQRGHKFREKKAKSEFLLHHHLKRIEARTEFRYASFNLSYAPRSSHRRRRRRHQLQHQLQHQLHPLPRSSRPSLPHPRRRRRPLHGPPARSAQQSEIACERCKRSGLANGAGRRDPRLGRAPLRRARKVAWAAARSSSSPRLAQSRPRRGRGWQALVVVAGPRRTSGARGARWQGMQAGGPGQAGRQAGRRPSLACGARRRAHRTGLLRSGLLLRSGEARGSASDDSSRTALLPHGAARRCAALRDLKAVVAGSVTLSVRLQHHSKLDSSRRYHRDQIKRVLILLLLLTLSLPRSLLRAPGGSSGGSTRRKRLGGRQEASTSTQSSKRALRRGAFGRCFSVATGACNSPHTPPNPLFARHSPRP